MDLQTPFIKEGGGILRMQPFAEDSIPFSPVILIRAYLITFIY
jgi:hypothetical protein